MRDLSIKIFEGSLYHSSDETLNALPLQVTITDLNLEIN